MPKYNLKTYGLLYSLLNEQYIINRIKENNNFIPQIISSFQDYENIYLITTYYDGPILSYFKNEYLSEEKIKFISACVIQSLKDIRRYKIIHRDVAYFNVIMDKNNYFNLIDFSFSIDYDHRKANNLKCNFDGDDTPPEIRSNSDFCYNSDYYRLGQLILYWIFKKYPLNLEEIKNTNYFVNNKTYSNELFDFVSDVTKKNIKERLGYKDINELMNHPWFNGFLWKKLETKDLTSPFNYSEFKINRPICDKYVKKFENGKDYLLVKNSMNEYYQKLKKF